MSNVRRASYTSVMLPSFIHTLWKTIGCTGPIGAAVPMRRSRSLQGVDDSLRLRSRRGSEVVHRGDEVHVLEAVPRRFGHLVVGGGHADLGAADAAAVGDLHL